MRNTFVSLIILFILVPFSSNQADGAGDNPPEAFFSASPISGQYPLTVSFDATSSTDIDGMITSYSWDFGDHGKGEGEKVSHTYKNFGTYTATLTVTDNQGLSNSYSSKIKVASGNGFYVTIDSAPSIGPDEPSMIRVIVRGKGGAPISGASVTIAVKPGGKISPNAGQTDASGQFISNFTGPLGNFVIITSVKKPGLFMDATDLQAGIKVIKKYPLSVAVESIPNGASSTIRVKVTGSGNMPIPGARVMLAAASNGTLIPDSGLTDSAGQFISNFTSAEGKGTVKVSVLKMGFTDGSAEIQVSVSGTDYGTFAVVPVILILAATGAYAVKNGKLKLIPAQKSVPCDGKSTLQIKVLFVDASGKPKKQDKECMVQMLTTSGNIQDVVIPAGKEAADATLISSKECGTVIVTAKSGWQKTRAEVNFECNETGLELMISPAKIAADGKSIGTVSIRIKDDKGNYVTPLNERMVDVTTTLGTITNPVKISSKSVTGIGFITSGLTSGTATVKASLGSLREEKTIVFEALAERYCMECGNPMKKEAQTCPYCGKVPPTGGETKQCSNCEIVLPGPANFCYKCGAKQPV